MFSKGVVNSARFLRMPPTSRLLYYDLGMAADDDGVVEAFTVMRTTSAEEDDLRVLAAKGFVIILNEDLVSYICDWRQNNAIRSDRYKPSLYKELLVRVVGYDPAEQCGIPCDNQTETSGKPSIDKDSTVEGSIDEDSLGKYSQVEPSQAKARTTEKRGFGGEEPKPLTLDQLKTLEISCKQT